MSYETIASTFSIIIASVLAVLQTIEAIKKNKTDKTKVETDKKKTISEALKVDVERQDLEDRITERVLARAEAELAKLKTENDKLRGENADLLKMMRAMRMITIKLVKKMEENGIDPDLTQEEREALYDTGKLTEFAKRQK